MKRILLALALVAGSACAQWTNPPTGGTVTPGPPTAISTALRLAISNETAARVAADAALSNAVSGLAVGTTDAVARAWAQAGSNLAASASGAAATADVKAAQGQVLGTNALTLATTASNLAAAAYDLASAGGGSSTDSLARAWAVAGSNLALSASRASTDLTARASATAAAATASGAVQRTGDTMTGDLVLRKTGGAYPAPAFVQQWDSGAPSGEVYVRVYFEGNNAYIIYSNALTCATNKIWERGNQGPGSGMDADTVDGVHAASLLPLTTFQASQAMTNTLLRVPASNKTNVFVLVDGAGVITTQRVLSVSAQ